MYQSYLANTLVRIERKINPISVENLNFKENLAKMQGKSNFNFWILEDIKNQQQYIKMHGFGNTKI